MYAVLPSYALGFHGCDATVAQSVFSGKAHLRRSKNDFDWLGEGVYFWENNPARALQYARELRDRPRGGAAKIRKPAVVGAVIELGYCLNLLDSQFLSLVREAYEDLKDAYGQLGDPLPKNKKIAGDLLLRPLDCAVINYLHQTRTEDNLQRFDTVRAAFAEGGALYPGAGITAKHHIQLCVRRRSCIKGYFRVLDESKLPRD